jgi:hypothetical protein
MTREQEEELIIRCLAGEAGEADLAHLKSCSACRIEVEKTRDALFGFRSTVRQWSEGEFVAAESLAAKPVGSRLAAWAPGLAFMLLLVFIGSRIVITQRASEFRAATDRDAALLNQVRIDLARPVPSGMEPLFTLVSPEIRESATQLP